MRRNLVVGSALLAAAVASPVTNSSVNHTAVYDMNEIIPSTDLVWTPCYENFTCARLIVPLDYTCADAGNTTIAYIKYSSPDPQAEDILFNPGGPGGSGVNYVLSEYSNLLRSLGLSYNLVGFDPRGVGYSGPNLTCFPDDSNAEKLFASQFERPINSKSTESVVREFEIAGAWGDWCSMVHRNDSAKYAGTVATATDLLNYVEKKALAGGKKADDAKLWYWGISHGTVLGATYAALFPHRIGRVILDGVVDSETYYQGQFGDLSQADEAVFNFTTACWAASSHCTLYAETPDIIATRMRAVLEDLRNDPVPVSDPEYTSLPTLVTYQDLVFTLWASVYSPVQGFPILAQIFTDLEQRNGTSLASMIQKQPPTGLDYGGLIASMDMWGVDKLSTIELWKQHVQEINDESQWVGDAWASVALSSRTMEIVPPESQRFKGVPGANETSFPILFIGNTVDPITPIVGAKKMSMLFPGSALLTQNSVGHTSTAAISNCTSRYIQQYLKGMLPPVNVTCEVESVPFLANV